MAYTFNPFTGTFDNAPSTINGDSAYSTLCAISGDLVDYGYLHGGFLPLSGGTLTGNLSSLSSVYIDGSFEVTGTGTSVLYVEGTKVGINTETPNEELTVVGDISASGIIYGDASGLINVIDSDLRSLSANWESTYSTVQANSADWDKAYDIATEYSLVSSTFLTSETDSQTLTFNETNKDLTISNGNTVSLSALVDDAAIDTEMRGLTANWETTYSIVSALSSEWGSADEVLLARVFNADSVTLNRGDVVYTFGANGDTMSVKRASNSSEATSSKTVGVINDTIDPNQIGYATVAGRITKLSLPGPTFAEGDPLYLGTTPGTFTNIEPITPLHSVYLGVVERANNGNGIAYIKVQNGYELKEIHDVLITNPSENQVIQLSSNGTDLIWVNDNIDKTDVAGYENWESTYNTVSSLSGDWITLNTVTDYLSTNNVLVSSITVTDQLSTIGNVFVGGSLAAGGATSATIYAEGTLVGINTEAPNEELTVVGDISATGVVYANEKQVVTTLTTTVPGTSAITTIVAVSALPGTQEPGTLYILV